MWCMTKRLLGAYRSTMQHMGGVHPEARALLDEQALDDGMMSLWTTIPAHETDLLASVLCDAPIEAIGPDYHGGPVPVLGVTVIVPSSCYAPRMRDGGGWMALWTFAPGVNLALPGQAAVQDALIVASRLPDDAIDERVLVVVTCTDAGDLCPSYHVSPAGGREKGVQ